MADIQIFEVGIKFYEFYFGKSQIRASGRIRGIPLYTIFIPLGENTRLAVAVL
jgi:hypothetical protein